MEKKLLLMIILGIISCHTFAATQAVYDHKIDVNFDVDMNARFTPYIQNIKIMKNGEIESLELTLLANDDSGESKAFTFSNGKLQAISYKSGGSTYYTTEYRKSGNIKHIHSSREVGKTIYTQNDDDKVVNIERDKGFHITVLKDWFSILDESYSNEKQLKAAYPTRQDLSIEDAIARKSGIKEENLSSADKKPTLEELLVELKMLERELILRSDTLKYSELYSLDTYLEKWKKNINEQADKMNEYDKIKFLIYHTEIIILKLKYNKFLEK